MNSYELQNRLRELIGSPELKWIDEEIKRFLNEGYEKVMKDVFGWKAERIMLERLRKRLAK